MHRLNIKLDAKPVKQQQHWFRPNIMEAIEVKVHKLIAWGFIREEQHPDWVTNIVPVLKKNEKIWICIDYHDLNTACPKDEFSLPITDVMIDNTCGFEEYLSWTAFQGIIRLRCIQRMRSILRFGCHWGYTAIL